METDPMTERKRFISDYLSRLYSVVELCERYRISRKTGHKWISRFKRQGQPGLADHSRAAHSCPHRTQPAVVELLVATRRAHPAWGPEKIISWLAPRHPGTAWPAPSTVSALFLKLGLVRPYRRRRHHKHPGVSPLVTRAPNDIWTVDFKGHFRTRDGVYCYPLTVVDQHSRRILACVGLLRPDARSARPVFEMLFRRFGLPLAIRSDNGSPFASNGIHGFTALNVWWMSLGITHQRIHPASPQENGAHERMHRTLKQAVCRPPHANLTAQQRAFDAFVTEFNEDRPHAALDGATPASLYKPSPRKYSGTAPAQRYPEHFEVKRVNHGGYIRLKGEIIFLATPLVNYRVGLEEVEDGVWSIFFNNFLIARISEEDYKLRP
jgi:transposase InsO family protein